jgi:hypothetical protein
VSGPHDVPTAAELIESVREWLERDVMSTTEGRLQFHARVATNVLAMVERELALGDAHAEAHWRRLDRLGVSDDTELATAIRRRELDASTPGLLDALRAAVDDKLEVANPRYPTEIRS